MLECFLYDSTYISYLIAGVMMLLILGINCDND